jgi:hypothetical protein
MRSRIAAVVCLWILAGCGGGDGGSAPPPVVPPPPPAAPPPPPVVGSSGGTVTEASGASVVVPAGALSADTTIRIARDSTGAPAVPAELTPSGSMYVITPHGGNFAEPVEVRIPAPAVTLQPNQLFKLAKAQPDGEWVVLEDTELDAGVLSAEVNSFSFFTVVTVTYLVPIAQAAPLTLSAELTCEGLDCRRAMGTVNANYVVTGNGGALPANCSSPNLRIFASPNVSYSSYSSGVMALPTTGGSLSRVIEQSTNLYHYTFGVGLRCAGSSAWTVYRSLEKRVQWLGVPQYPNISVLRVPQTLDIVEGAEANIEVVFGGGASQSGDQFNSVSNFNRTIIDWERSDNGGLSWRVIARSYENEANPWVYAAPAPWMYWSVRHVFTGTIADQGALIRTHACFTPRDIPPPACVTGLSTRINVLQQGAVASVVTGPRSMLVRTGQTASLAVTLAGLPAPTVLWQTRPANSTGAWTDIAAPGANTANYTTAALALSDNGVQFRAVATNSMGTANSSIATVSVSNVDVEPSFTTQPASLSVASGSDAVFAVDALGTEALSYQWFRNAAAIAGANGPVLRIPGATAINAGSYTVMVSNAAGNATSNSAILTVSAGAPAAVAPSIVTQPASVTANAGSTATLAVGVDGTGPFTFQWRRDGVNVAGATSAVLTFNSVALPNAGSFSVVVTNSAGSVTSSTAVLDVVAGSPATAPTITSQPATLIVPYRGSGVVAVGATGSGPLSYQWSKDGAELPGLTLPVLDFSIVAEQDVGTYTVTITNSVGSVTSQPASIILLGAPVITQQPADVTVLEGANATFFVAASSSGLRYQWSLNGNPIPGAIGATLNTGALVSANSGAVYSVMVYNGAGHVYSLGAVLTVIAFTPPSVIADPVSTSVVAGNAAPMCATFGGTPPFVVQMTRWSGTAWVPVLAARLINDNLPACTVTPVLELADNDAQFRFEAISGPGQAYSTTTNPAYITVTAPPTITQTTLVSRASTGVPANNRSYWPSLSADGTLLAFKSEGTNLVPGFATTFGHAYVRNLQTGVVTTVNQTVAGTESATSIVEMKLAAGGRYVVFSSLAGDLVPGDTNGSLDVFRRDLQTGTTERVNVLANGDELPGTGNAVGDMRLDISADGNFIIWSAFHDMAGAGAALPYMGLFIRNMQSDQTTLVAMGSGYNIGYAAISASGEYVAYSLPQVSPVRETLWLYDAEADDTYNLFEMAPTNGVDFMGQGISISGDGRYTAFALRSTPLLGTNITQTVVIDRTNPGTLIVASTGTVGSGIGLGNATSNWPEISADGRFVIFSTQAPNISGGVGNTLDTALMVRDLQTETTSVASRRANGTGVRTALQAVEGYDISDDGSMVVFSASEYDMSGGPQEQHLYASPRP